MPEDPQGKGNFEYENNQPGRKYKSTGSEEELGDMHLSTENYSVALEYYEKVVKKLHSGAGSNQDFLRIYRKIGDCYWKKGLLREAMTFLDSAEGYCDEDDIIGKGTITCRRGDILYERGEIKKALRAACAGYKVLRLSDEHKEVAHAQLLIACCYARLGRSEEAEQFFLDALSSYRRINDAVGESSVLNNLGLFHKNACRWGRALQFLNRALAICDEVGLTQHRVRVTLNLGIVHLKKRDFANAESAFARARTMAKRIGDDLKYTRATLMLGVKETRAGNLLAAEKHLLEGRVMAERRNYRREIALADEFLGDLVLEKGELAGALENYTIALSESKKIAEENDITAEILRRMMNVYLLQKKVDQVISLGRKAIEICKKVGELHEIGFVERILGQAYAQVKNDTEAEKYINRSIRTFLSVNNPYEAHRSGVILGENLLKSGDRKTKVMARKLVNGTLDYFQRCGEFRDLAQSHYILSKIENDLGNRDECLLHVYESQRLAEDLQDRNLTRRLRRMRKKVELDVTGGRSTPSPVFRIPEELTEVFVRDAHLRSYLDYILSDLMRKLTAGHGFVALSNHTAGERKTLILARQGISEKNTREITAWFMDRQEADLSEKFLITDTAGDKRLRDIKGALPGDKAPAYFHPLNRGRDTFGLLFFQAEGGEKEAPHLGAIFDVVSTYAGFIGFLVRGILGKEKQGEKERISPQNGLPGIITCSDKMFKVLTLAERVAESNSTVLLMGETGTGKGLIAQAIHRMSPRRDRKYVHINCAALPETILESELFGHVKGSFTGAFADKKGLLAEADGGTIFLDEIGKTSLPLQGKLLQFLDTKEVRPVGSNEMTKVDVRLIFASKVDLLSLCREGRMLEDFYYRINDFPLTIPPLRERAEDIRLLAEHYLRVFCDSMGRNIMGFSPEAISYIMSREWPGNVRELEKIVKRAIILSDDHSVIVPGNLVFDPQTGNCHQQHSKLSLPNRVRQLEMKTVAEALKKNSWNRKITARELGISYPTLLKKIRDYKIDPDA
ncbi:MAG: sigma 54-interacting transcriptional regulator [Candidatus Krumholzibacteriota bacterium]|nr:sigma 54-interacting transcriptional regulator [Candidatus Krumholzibacteriota bacterium]